MSERERLVALWATVEPERREELKRSLRRGEQAPDPELAWFGTMTMGESTEGFAVWFYVASGVVLCLLVVTTLTVLVMGVGTGNVSRLWYPLIFPVVPILVLVTWAFHRASGFRRAYRLNKLIAVPPRGWRG